TYQHAFMLQAGKIAANGRCCNSQRCTQLGSRDGALLGKHFANSEPSFFSQHMASPLPGSMVPRAARSNAGGRCPRSCPLNSIIITHIRQQTIRKISGSPGMYRSPGSNKGIELDYPGQHLRSRTKASPIQERNHDAAEILCILSATSVLRGSDRDGYADP